MVPEKCVEVDGVGDFFAKEEALLEESEFFLSDGREWEGGGDTTGDEGAGGEVLPVGV